MKTIIIILALFVFVSCKEEKRHWWKWVENDKIGLDDYWRMVTGYDSLQITANYEGTKLKYNFCYANKFRDYKKDTLYFDMDKMPYLKDSSGYLVPNVNEDSIIILDVSEAKLPFYQ